MAAAGLLAWAYSQNGRWEESVLLANRLHTASPREPFREIDLLFKSYGLVWTHPDLAVDQCDDVIELEPTWGSARLLKAIAAILQAEEHSRREQFDEATHQLSLAKELLPNPESALLLSVRLFHARKVVGLASEFALPADVVEAAKQEGLELVDDFSRRFPGNLKGRELTADFYDSIGADRLAEQAWDQVILQSGPDDQFWLIGRLHRDKSPDVMLGQIDALSSDDKMIRAARAFVLVNVPGGRDKALAIYRDLIAEDPTEYMRYVAIQIPLLLGEFELAKRQCEEWTRQESSQPHSTGSIINEEVLIEMLAGDTVSDSMGPPETRRNEKISRAYALGMIALGKGNRKQALEHFEDRMALRGSNCTANWAGSFVQWLKNDPEWPLGNRRIHPEGLRAPPAEQR